MNPSFRAEIAALARQHLTLHQPDHFDLPVPIAPSLPAPSGVPRVDDLGYSMVVYFPPEAPWAEVDALCDKIADLVMDTTGWDADVSGVAGNVWNDQ